MPVNALLLLALFISQGSGTLKDVTAVQRPERL